MSITIFKGRFTISVLITATHPIVIMSSKNKNKILINFTLKKETEI